MEGIALAIRKVGERARQLASLVLDTDISNLNL